MAHAVTILFYSRQGEAYQICWTHLPLDKMAAILADNIYKCVFLNENFTEICSQESNWQ